MAGKDVPLNYPNSQGSSSPSTESFAPTTQATNSRANFGGVRRLLHTRSFSGLGYSPSCSVSVEEELEGPRKSTDQHLYAQNAEEHIEVHETGLSSLDPDFSSPLEFEISPAETSMDISMPSPLCTQPVLDVAPIIGACDDDMDQQSGNRSYVQMDKNSRSGYSQLAPPDPLDGQGESSSTGTLAQHSNMDSRPSLLHSSRPADRQSDESSILARRGRMGAVVFGPSYENYFASFPTPIATPLAPTPPSTPACSFEGSPASKFARRYGQPAEETLALPLIGRLKSIAQSQQSEDDDERRITDAVAEAERLLFGADGVDQDWEEAVRILKLIVFEEKTHRALSQATLSAMSTASENAASSAHKSGGGNEAMREEFAEAPKPYSFTVRPELSAAFGHAQAILAFCYEFSMGCQPDYPLCEDLYKKAALHGSGLACTRLSFLRRYGRPSVRIDRVEAEGWSRRVNEIGPSAIQWLVEAAQTYEIPSANYALGLCYHDGVGMPRSPEMAVHFYRKAAAAEHPRGLGILGYCYGDGYGVEKDETLAFGYYLRAAQVGESVSMYNVAHALEEGVGTERNLAEAVNWYRRAAALGNCFAQNALGYLFEEGFAGLPRDEVAAVRWYALAAHQGYPWAQCNLGFCLVSGIGVAARDEVRGAYWYHAAARQGHSRAQHNLGHAYLYGIGVRRDEHRAVEWFLRAARANNPFALHSLGYCFHHGIAVPTDERRALALYRRAAKLGHPPAQLSLGRCYLDGVGVSTGEDDEPDTVAQNNRRAFKWIRRAALAGGNDLAMNTLAHLYEAGIGVRASFRKAITHYWNSARMGNSCALANLSFMYLENLHLFPTPSTSAAGTAMDLPSTLIPATTASDDGGNPLTYATTTRRNHRPQAPQDTNCDITTEDPPNSTETANESNEQPTTLPSTPLFRPTPQQVLHLVRLAANEGQPRAQERLGDLLFMGNPRLNLPRDYSEAVMWYELSAMGGNITAMTKLGNCLEGGIGCERDVDSAVDWFAKAAALGDADAARYLAPLLALRPSRRRRRRIRQSAATIPGQADGDSVIVLSSSPSTTSPLSSSLHLTGPSGLSITIPAMPLTPPSTPAEADSAADDDELGAESYIEDDGAEDDDDDDYEEYEEYEEYDDDDFYDDDDSMEPSSAAYTRGFSIVAGTVAPAA